MGRFIAVELNPNHEPAMAIRPEPLMIDSYSCSVTAARKRWLIRSLSRLLGFTTISLRLGFVDFRQSLVLSLSKPMQATKVRAQESRKIIAQLTLELRLCRDCPLNCPAQR